MKAEDMSIDTGGLSSSDARGRRNMPDHRYNHIGYMLCDRKIAFKLTKQNIPVYYHAQAEIAQISSHESRYAAFMMIARCCERLCMCILTSS